MTLQDIPRVQEIDRLSFSLPWPEKSYHFELTENPSSLALVAEFVSDAGTQVIIGMAVVWILEDEAHIATIAIHPEFRGHAYGKKLLAETLKQSFNRGANLATLEVRENNLVAQHIYLDFGFEIAGRREKYYKDNNEAALIMTLVEMGPEYFDWLETLGISS
jgi:[ribosomal protein S18]-alanine N-acetyltransferase